MYVGFGSSHLFEIMMREAILRFTCEIIEEAENWYMLHSKKANDALWTFYWVEALEAVYACDEKDNDMKSTNNVQFKTCTGRSKK